MISESIGISTVKGEGNAYTDNKQLLVIPGASHTDLYDGGDTDAIPFDKLAEFYAEYLK